MSTPNDLSPQNRRIHPRYPVMWQGTISAETEFDAYVINCSIRNVSITGVHVLVDRAVAADSVVKLHISGVGVFEGRVSWSEDERLGVHRRPLVPFSQNQGITLAQSPRVTFSAAC